jgi:putative transposase
MGQRKISLMNGEYYHVYNRGVDKRSLFSDSGDLRRFFRSIKEFNVIEPIQGLHRIDNSSKELRGLTTQETGQKLVNIICYCINLNHFHFLLKQEVNNGISEFMKRLGGGYTRYFNIKHDRSGSLFQGTFKSSHISSDEHLLRMSAYVNLNFKVHNYNLRGLTTQVMSSWGEYAGGIGSISNVTKENSICDTSVIMKYFKTKRNYKKFAEKTIKEIIRQRKEDKELDNILFD